MSAVDKNAAVVEWLLTCPIIRDNPLFFNFTDAEDGSNQITTEYDDKKLHEPYIDGSVLKRYTFSVVGFRSISYNQIVKMPGYTDENLETMATLQEVIDWITEQAELRNYPKFDTDCEIEEMESLADEPTIVAIDTKSDPPLAAYNIGVVITYLDVSKMVWKH